MSYMSFRKPNNKEFISKQSPIRRKREDPLQSLIQSQLSETRPHGRHDSWDQSSKNGSISREATGRASMKGQIFARKCCGSTLNSTGISSNVFDIDIGTSMLRDNSSLFSSTPSRQSFSRGSFSRSNVESDTIVIQNLPEFHTYDRQNETANMQRLKERCETFGPIDQIRIVYIEETGACKGCAYVMFKSKAAAANAASVLNGQGVGTVRVRLVPEVRIPSRRTVKIEGSAFAAFSQFDSNHKEEDMQLLKDELSVFGKIEDVKILYDGATNACRGITYIVFQEEKSAAKAIRALGGLDDYKIGIVQSATAGGMHLGDRVRVHNVSSTAVSSAETPLTSYEGGGGVIFTSCPSEERKTTSMPKHPSRNRSPFDLSIRDGSTQTIRKPWRTIAVRDVPLDFHQSTDGDNVAALKCRFGCYGTVQSIRILYDAESGKCTGQVFICFNFPAEAQKSVTAMKALGCNVELVSDDAMTSDIGAKSLSPAREGELKSSPANLKRSLSVAGPKAGIPEEVNTVTEDTVSNLFKAESCVKFEDMPMFDMHNFINTPKAIQTNLMEVLSSKGSLKDVIIEYDPVTNKHFGLVTFSEREDAQNVVKNMHNCGGCSVKIISSSEDGSTSYEQVSRYGNRTIVVDKFPGMSFFAEESKEKDAQMLKDKFSAFGIVTFVNLVYDADSKHCLIALVTFRGPINAVKAVNMLGESADYEMSLYSARINL